MDITVQKFDAHYRQPNGTFSAKGTAIIDGGGVNFNFCNHQVGTRLILSRKFTINQRYKIVDAIMDFAEQ